MACNSPEFASHGVCAAVIPINDHTTTSNNKAMVPMNLRVRIVMAEMCSSPSIARLARRKGHTIRCLQIPSSAASMTVISARQVADNRAIRWWLLSIAVLIAVMVLVGGATRLTESGLSIVEWKPVTGTLPPLSEAQWIQAFEAYKTIPQYRELNAGMNLAEFRTIFWWEWSHRLLGRIIGVAYLLPFLWFLWRGVMGAELRRRLWLIFGLGALQGAVGWWMVASGLSQRVEVSHYRLATHLVLALLIFATIVWTLRRLANRPPSAASLRLKITGMALVVLTFVQLYLGALVAGLRAGKVYNTWPDIDGAFVPSAARLFFETPWWRNLFDNTLTVQFEHRMTAYALLVLAMLHALDAVRSRADGAVVRGAWSLLAVIALQATLGILTLLNQAPMDLALTHQAVAIAVLTLAVLQTERLTRR
ncbi:MAG: heme a synthase, partial [Methylobacteriaceae bacterium]|nr:heme a synthase [Methylobacteriaceae bacterium]